MSAPTRRVAILLNREFAYTREVLRGIQDYLATGVRWFIHQAPADAQVFTAMREWAPDGVIAHVFDEELARGLSDWGGLVVNTTSTIEGLGFPLVEVNHHEAGRMAARYLLEQGHRQFAFFGSNRTGFSRGREAGFREVIERAGFEVRSCHADSLLVRQVDESWVRFDEEVVDWLRSLARPCAVFVSNDTPARTLANICRAHGFEVPEEIALLSVDNDEFECLLTSPTLSSIEIPARQIGFTAAQALETMMEGGPPPSRRTFLAPVRVVARASTDLVATQDEAVRSAVSFVRENFTRHISVSDVARASGCSRRTLERRFRGALGRTILEEIARQRVDLARSLLIDTDLDMESVATRSGFSDARRLSVVFRQRTGEAPTAFRRAARPTGRTGSNGRSGE